MAVKLTKYDVIKGPVISDKAYKLNQKQQQLVLEVHLFSNKPLIKKAIEELFDVKVKDIRTLIKKKSTARAAQKKYNAYPAMREIKIAYVTLAEGYSLNLFDQAPVKTDELEKRNAEG